eukprot:SAG11_NODE_2192_length_3701_cov_5.319367_3_plen_252_part_00
MTSTAATYKVGVQSGAQFSDLAAWSMDYNTRKPVVAPQPSVFSAQLTTHCAADLTCTFDRTIIPPGKQPEIPNSGGISYLLLGNSSANANYTFKLSIPDCKQSGRAVSNGIKVNVTISNEVSGTKNAHYGDAAMRPPTFMLRPMEDPGASCTASHNWTAASGGPKLIALEPTFVQVSDTFSREIPFNIDIEERLGESVVTTHTRSVWISASARDRLRSNPIFDPGSLLSETLFDPIPVRPRASPRLRGGYR